MLRQLISGSTCCIITIALLGFVFPEVWRGPFGQVSPELKTLWLNHVQELHTLGLNLKELLLGILNWLPIMIPGLIGLFILASRFKKMVISNQILLSSWLLITTITTLLAFYQIRWVCYSGIVWTPLAACTIFLLFERLKKQPLFRVYRAFILVAVCAGPVFLSIQMDKNETTATPSKEDGTPVTHDQKLIKTTESLPRFIETVRQINQPESTILTFMDMGPEILYRTQARTIASPYHRNHQGIIDSHQILSSSDFHSALSQLKARGINWIIVGDNPTEASYYGEDAGTLYQGLINSTNIPDSFSFFARVQTPETSYLIYQVLDN